MGDDEVRFVDGDEGARFGYQPKQQPGNQQEGYQPAQSLNPSTPPPGKGDTPAAPAKSEGEQ